MQLPTVSRRLLRVYVDETGDRGSSGKSSRFFAFSAVFVPDEDHAAMRAAVQTIRGTLGVPAGKPLHWKEHVKTFGRRQYVTSTLGAVPGLQVAYVIVDKTVVTANLQTNQVRFYNYAAGLILERAVLAARD